MVVVKRGKGEVGARGGSVGEVAGRVEKRTETKYVGAGGVEEEKRARASPRVSLDEILKERTSFSRRKTGHEEEEEEAG